MTDNLLQRTSHTNKRFVALDVFRGLTVCLMLIVNFPGSEEFTYAPLNHAKWNGFTPTDFVFPAFLFAVGNAMIFSVPKWQALKTSQVLYKIFKRIMIIFLIGYLLSWFPFSNLIAIHPFKFNALDDSRILGVLQRIALTYCIASLLLYFLGWRTTIVISICILILYYFVLVYFGTGTDPFDVHTNAVLRLDKWALGEKHLYNGEGFRFDAEGLLSTFPAFTNVIVGYVAGKFIQQKGKTYKVLSKLMMAGFIFLMIGLFWSYVFPINKKLWTSSFALITSGISCLLLACIMYYIDFLHKKKGVYFFEVFGKNPLFIYCFSIAFVLTTFYIPVENDILINWVYKTIFSKAGSYFGSFLFAGFYMLFCWSICYVLDKKKIYIRI